MNRMRGQRTDPLAGSRLDAEFFDLAGSDPEVLNSGRIPDPQPQHTPLFRWLAGRLTRLEAYLRARGGRSLRLLIRLFWGLVAAIGVFLLLGPIINKPLDFDDVLDSAELSEVDWVARDAEIDYGVSRADDGGFAAEIEERYTADFLNGPERRIERTIVTEFEGHDAEFALRTATIDGVPADVEVDRHLTTTDIVLRRPDGEQFSGRHEITIGYELHHLVAVDTDQTSGRTVDRWSWPLFAPTWPQATKGIEVSLTLPAALDDALVRAPQAHVGWLLVAANVWLTPEEAPDGAVRYSFSNDDTLPPNADIWLNASFEPGTFVLPPTTALFWVQTYGPLLPLAVLAILTLCALAARRIVWADSAGEPWYLPRFEPPEGLDPALAAGLLGRPGHAELVAALAALRPRTAPAKPRRAPQRPPAQTADRLLRRAAQAGRRAGRVGNFISTARHAGRWAAHDAVVERRLRWVPDSYLRDSLLFAPVAITLVQWGLLRQLNAQVILSVVWWPVAFVLVSTALAAVAVRAVWRPRPLTRDGAIAVQQLKGVDVWASGTRLLARGPLDDPLLPYAVLFERPRRAGNAVTELAVGESRDRGIARGWRTADFLSIPALLAFAVSAAVLAASIVLVATQAAPYDEDLDHVTWANDLPGTLYSQVRGMDISGELRRDDDGRARIDVVERLTVEFNDDSARVPQFAREWPTERLGQSLGLEFGGMRIDGETVPVGELPQERTRSLAVVTRLDEVLSGVHQVEVEYSLDAAAVDASNGPDTIQQVRWTAWYEFWESEFYRDPSRPFDGTEPVRPIRLRFTIAPDLADAIVAGGWIDWDGEQARIPLESGNTFAPWETESSTYTDDGQRHEFRIGSVQRGDDGSLVALLDVEAIESREADTIGEGGAFGVDEEFNAGLDKYTLGLSADLGVRLDFPAGTFSGVDPEGYAQYRGAYALPYGLLLGLAGLVVALAIGVAVAAFRLRGAANASLRLVGLGALPLLAIAQSVLFFWAVMPMPGGNTLGGAAIAVGALMWLAAVAAMISVGRRSPASVARAGKSQQQAPAMGARADARAAAAESGSAEEENGPHD